MHFLSSDEARKHRESLKKRPNFKILVIHSTRLVFDLGSKSFVGMQTGMIK